MIDTIRIKCRPFLDKYFLIFLLLFSLLSLLPNIYFFAPLQVSYLSGLFYRGALLIVFSLSFVLIIVIYNAVIPKSIWIGCGIYIIAQILTIFISPHLKNVNLPALSTIMGVSQSFIIGITIIGFVTIHKEMVFDIKVVNLSCLFMMVLGFLLCFYTYIFEYDDIIHTFNSEYGWNYDVTSLFLVKTEYGFTLLMCSLFSIFYILNNKKYWLYIVPIFFLINMFISRSKTSILCLSIVLITLLTIHIIQSWSKYKKYWIISTITISVFFVVLITLTFFKIGWFSNFNYYITQVILGDAKVVWIDRVHKWSLLFNAIDNPFNIIFGYGERVAPLILSECRCATIGDNIYLSNYGTGGIIKFTLYILLALYIIRLTWTRNIPLFKKIICLSIELSFLVGGIFEDDSIVGVTMSGLFSSIVFYSCNKMIMTN